MHLSSTVPTQSRSESSTSPRPWPAPPPTTTSDAELDAFDPVAARAAARWFAVLGRYHRLEVRGLERLPDGPCVLVGNHNGGLYPGDGLFLVEYYRRFGFERPVFVLTHDAVFAFAPLGRLVRRVGMVRAGGGPARAALARGDKVLVFPGGDLENLRPFGQRARVVLGGHAGFARLAAEANVPVVPIVSAGSHETMIVVNQGRRLAGLLGLRRRARIESFPTALCLPWGVVFGPGCGLPYLPLPAKITVEVGEPIAPARASAGTLYERTEAAMQRLLDGLYAERRLPLLG
jgi:1-acyl-sn-glycerol-3-phosphate acyltransferase